MDGPIHALPFVGRLRLAIGMLFASRVCIARVVCWAVGLYASDGVLAQQKAPAKNVDTVVLSNAVADLVDLNIQADLQPADEPEFPPNPYRHGLLRISATIVNADTGIQSGLLKAKLVFNGSVVESKSLRFSQRGGTSKKVVLPFFKIDSVKKWNAEQPNMYQVVLSLEHHDGRLILTKSYPVGFRSVERRQKQFLINGQQVELRAIQATLLSGSRDPEVSAQNRNGQDRNASETNGWTCTRRELDELKRLNINAIETSGIVDSRILSLCDSLGFYVISGIEIDPIKDETSRRTQWLDQQLDRVKSTIRQHERHPSVVLWSLGAENENRIAQSASYDWIRRNDKTRPVICNSTSPAIADLVASDADGIDQLIARSLSSNRPLLHTNMVLDSPQAIEDLTKIRMVTSSPESGKHSLGGFSIGEFQSAVALSTVAQSGVAWSKQIKHYKEIKKALAPIRVRALDLKKGQIELENMNDFQSLSDYDCQFEIHQGGRTLQRGSVGKSTFLPHRKLKVLLPIQEMNRTGKFELLISFVQGQPSPFAAQGQVVMSELFEFELADDREVVDQESLDKQSGGSQAVSEEAVKKN